MIDHMKKPCENCPFRKDVKPFLHPDRALELAYHSKNPFNNFTCHKTLGHDEEGETCQTEKSKECAGFMTMQLAQTGRTWFEDFEPSDLVYEEPADMVQAYSNAWFNKK